MLLTLTTAALVLIAPANATQTQSQPSKTVGSLGVGQSVFWDGEYVLTAHAQAAAFAYFFAPPEAQAASDPCLTGSAYCRLYTLDVTQAGGTLRVALDASRRSDCWGVELRNPAGDRAAFPTVCVASQVDTQAYNAEAIVADAAPGTWEIRVVIGDAEDLAFRMRARLEPAREKEPKKELRPNLVPWLPWEFGFVAAANPDAGTASDAQNPPGPPGTTCHGDEQPASKCLRFSAGVYNVGDGPLYLVFTDDKAAQHVYYSDDTPGAYVNNETEGNYREHEAGDAEFHPSHAHRHFKDMVLYELFAVGEGAGPPPFNQPRPMTRIGTGDKHGWCSITQQFQDWRSFAQDDASASWPGFDGLCDTFFTIERGWGDVYRWQRPGQYVPYDEVADPDGTMRAGFYVVRVTVDPENLLLEAHDNDNVGYAYIRVIDGALPHSDRVVICERGFGHSPWDPNKQLTEEDPFLWANQLRNPGFTSETC